MIGFSGYSGNYDPDPEFQGHWHHNKPAEPEPEQPLHWNDIPWDLAKSEPASEPPRPTAQSERALHEFSMIVDDVASRRGLKLLLQSVRTELGRLRPGGNWTSAEVTAAGKALADATNALDLWTVMEERYFGDA